MENHAGFAEGSDLHSAAPHALALGRCAAAAGEDGSAARRGIVPAHASHRWEVGLLPNRIGRALSAKLTRVTLDRFIAAHASKGRTLDLGAQNGPYAGHFPRRIAVDLNPGAGVQLRADAHMLPFLDGSFDVVLCTEVLEHLPEPQRAIDEMYRVLQPGGQLLLTTRFLFPIHDAPHDYFRYTKYGLRYLLRRFDQVQIEEETDSVGT